MLLARSLLFDACLYGLMAVMGIVGLPAAAVSREWTYRWIRAYCRIVFWLLRAICGLRVEVRGAVPQGEVIVCSKHQSFLDILILCHALPRAKFVMKKELRWAPILGLYAMRMGSTPVARGRRSRAMRDMVSHVSKDAGRPSQLVIYPQGTRVAPGAYLPYKAGAGVLYERLGLDCVPAATNAGVFWSRRSWYRRPGLAVLEFLEPIAPGMPVKTFMPRLEALVEAASNRLMREAGFDPGSAGEPARAAAGPPAPPSR